MKFICDKATLSSAIAGVSRAVAAHSNIPILETILFHAEQGRIILTGYDLEMAITTSVPAIVSSPGEIALSAKLIGDMVRRMNTDDVEIECGENRNHPRRHYRVYADQPEPDGLPRNARPRRR